MKKVVNVVIFYTFRDSGPVRHTSLMIRKPLKAQLICAHLIAKHSHVDTDRSPFVSNKTEKCRYVNGNKKEHDLNTTIMLIESQHQVIDSTRRLDTRKIKSLLSSSVARYG